MIVAPFIVAFNNGKNEGLVFNPLFIGQEKGVYSQSVHTERKRPYTLGL
jgi:hypothetical protein